MKILIAEDDAVSRLLLSATLKKQGHEVVATQNGVEAWEIFQREHFPIIISDWMMPDMDGLELCRHVRALGRQQYTYLILLTALGGKTNFLDAMDAGADDFISKPFDEDQLAARLRVAIRILDLHVVLHYQATRDRLTSVWNRGAILELLERELDRAARDGAPVSVVLLDLDNFKRINDTHGHLAGDAVLREVSRRMREVLRSFDSIGRYGGEEFLIVLPDCMRADARTVAERVRGVLDATPVEMEIQMEAVRLAVTCSAGVAVSVAGRYESIDALIAAADAALYRAKDAGRNRVECADERAATEAIGVTEETTAV